MISFEFLTMNQISLTNLSPNLKNDIYNIKFLFNTYCIFSIYNFCLFSPK